MKIHLLSDLHLEFQRGPSWKPEPLDVDVVILAGDISSHTYGLDWATWAFKEWPSKPKLLYVAGNHEYYGAHLGMLAELQKPSWENAGGTFLEKRAVEIDGVCFLGCTLWSGFNLYGREHQVASMEVAQRGIADYDVISGREGRALISSCILLEATLLPRSHLSTTFTRSTMATAISNSPWCRYISIVVWRTRSSFAWRSALVRIGPSKLNRG